MTPTWAAHYRATHPDPVVERPVIRRRSDTMPGARLTGHSPARDRCNELLAAIDALPYHNNAVETRAHIALLDELTEAMGDLFGVVPWVS